MAVKIISGIVYLAIINICLLGIFRVDIPWFIYTINYCIIIAASIIYTWLGYKILKKAEENNRHMESVYLKEKQIASKEAKYQQQFDELNNELKDMTFQFSSLMLKIRDLLTEKRSSAICDVFAEIMEKIAGVTRAQIFFKEGRELYVARALGMNVSEYENLRVPFDDTTLIGMAGTSAQIMTSENLRPGQEFKGKQSEKNPISTIMALPVFVNNTVIGVINIEKMSERKYNKVDRLTFTTLSHLLGISLADSEIHW